jgi:hypothetical protein
MTENNDSLTRLAHATGMTDIEFEERSRIQSELAHQQVVRQWEEDQEADRQALKEFSENEDVDWGYHDQLEF